MKKDFRFYLFLLLFLLFIFLVVTIIFITFNSPMLCEGDSDKLTGIAKEVGDKVNTTLSGSNIQNNINANVDKPSINISNPDINIPSSVGTAIAQGASSMGIGATVVGGMRAMSHKTGGMTPGMRAAFVGFGGLLGAGAFIVGNSTSNYINSSSQRNSSNGPKNGPFPAKSIIEEGDSVESVMNFLYFNLFISILILLLVILLIYLFKKDKSKLVFITIFTLEILGYISYYLALNLYNDIGIISTIYQNSINYSVEGLNFNVDGVKMVKDLLIGNIIMSFSRLGLVFLFPGTYINYKVIHGNWDISFIKRIFGERFYYYFMKIYSYGSKTSLAWIYFCFFLLIFSCLMSILIGFFLIKDIDGLTEWYIKSKK
jgi:hypothetical protein